MNDPIRRTPAEAAVDAIASLENRSRYIEQSRRTTEGRPAEIAPRKRLSAFAYAREQGPRPALSDYSLRRGF